ncbi:MAG TPA: hypothetical protein VOA64_07865 [Candidatus Dormibacteraeota bacterium]|nr:hypothetical protein [Candidatus Dormibacteraeota bacterium]
MRIVCGKDNQFGGLATLAEIRECSEQVIEAAIGVQARHSTYHNLSEVHRNTSVGSFPGFVVTVSRTGFLTLAASHPVRNEVEKCDLLR